MLEIIKFIVVAGLMAAALIFETLSVFGVNRFTFSLNRLHAAAIGDTLAMSCVALAAIVYTGLTLLSLKYFLVICLMWLTSPVSGHLISLLVLRTDPNISKEVKPWNS